MLHSIYTEKAVNYLFEQCFIAVGPFSCKKSLSSLLAYVFQKLLRRTISAVVDETVFFFKIGNFILEYDPRILYNQTLFHFSKKKKKKT